MVLIYQSPNVHFVDFATQHNGGRGREKDLLSWLVYFLTALLIKKPIVSAFPLVTKLFDTHIQYNFNNNCLVKGHQSNLAAHLGVESMTSNISAALCPLPQLIPKRL
jgi:hypothetical protein